jgi:hypothetical protein
MNVTSMQFQCMNLKILCEHQRHFLEIASQINVNKRVMVSSKSHGVDNTEYVKNSSSETIWQCQN